MAKENHTITVCWAGEEATSTPLWADCGSLPLQTIAPSLPVGADPPQRRKNSGPSHTGAKLSVEAPDNGLVATRDLSQRVFCWGGVGRVPAEQQVLELTTHCNTWGK